MNCFPEYSSSVVVGHFVGVITFWRSFWLLFEFLTLLLEFQCQFPLIVFLYHNYGRFFVLKKLFSLSLENFVWHSLLSNYDRLCFLIVFVQYDNSVSSILCRVHYREDFGGR